MKNGRIHSRKSTRYGRAGFIGSHICDRLVEMGIEVVCADNLITGSKDNISHLLEKRV